MGVSVPRYTQQSRKISIYSCLTLTALRQMTIIDICTLHEPLHLDRMFDLQGAIPASRGEIC